MTGHVGLIGAHPEELMVLIRTAHEYKAHIMVTHGLHVASVNDRSNLEEALKLGAYLEINGTTMVPNMMHTCIDPNNTCDFIKEVGPENCIFNTDWGQPFVYDPVDGMRICIRMLLHFGFTEAEIRTMLKTNPEKYLFVGD
jgi:predicted metal-dependent phosphotriesterase family hydrolase